MPSERSIESRLLYVVALQTKLELTYVLHRVRGHRVAPLDQKVFLLVVFLNSLGYDLLIIRAMHHDLGLRATFLLLFVQFGASNHLSQKFFGRHLQLVSVVKFEVREAVRLGSLRLLEVHETRGDEPLESTLQFRPTLDKLYLLGRLSLEGLGVLRLLLTRHGIGIAIERLL